MRKEKIFFAAFLMIVCEVTLVGSFNEPRQGFYGFFSDRLDGLLQVINLDDYTVHFKCTNFLISSIQLRSIILNAQLEHTQIQAVLDKLQEARRTLAQDPSDDDAAARGIYFSQYHDARVKTTIEKVYGAIRQEMASEAFVARRRLAERR